MPLVEKPRPCADADELGQSRHERLIEHHLIGLSGRRAIRQRYRLVRTLKRAVGGRTLSDDQLDLVVPPIDCARSRLRRKD